VKAVVVHEHGGFDQLQVEDRPKPEPGNGEVRVRLAAVGLNHLDVWVRRGVPGHTFPLPLIPGSDGAGVIDANEVALNDLRMFAGLDLGCILTSDQQQKRQRTANH